MASKPVTVEAEITYPDRHAEHMELKHIEGSVRQFPIPFPNGGSPKVKAVATDFTKARALAESSVEVKPCERN